MMQTKNLLIEIGTAELPTASVEAISQDFLYQITNALTDSKISYLSAKRFATARRFAVYIQGVNTKQEDQNIKRKGPAYNVAKNKDGSWSKAVLGFARSNGVTPEELIVEETPKGGWLYYSATKPGEKTINLIPQLFYSSLNKLSIAKRMRWGSNTESFIRPITTITMLFDDEIIPVELFGVKSDRQSMGHRFHGKQILSTPSADKYEQILANSFVIADPDKRRNMIIEQITHLANSLSKKNIMASVVIDDNTLNEVNALVEFPNAIMGSFNPRYLELPQEVLIKTMQDNQKYFALVDHQDKILPYFITIANIDSKDAEQVRVGNQRVIEPRFSDAEFFWKNDLKQPLSGRYNDLSHVVYQQKLGSVSDRVTRTSKIAELIVDKAGGSVEKVKRSVMLSKCDLVTEMVFEFGELQGIMGEYYALKDGEDNEVAAAIREHYLPKFSGDSLPKTKTGLIIALADKIENIIGGFSVGAQPTGTKDPYSLRRASLGVIRLLNETSLDLDLGSLITKSASFFPDNLNTEKQIKTISNYINERLKGYYQEKRVRQDVFEAVIKAKSSRIRDITNRINALTDFLDHPDAKNLFAANKRITNLLKKAKSSKLEVNERLFSEESEKALFSMINKVKYNTGKLLQEKKYLDTLVELSTLRILLDDFFDKVMIMSDDIDERSNRLALLASIRELFLEVADTSLIQID